MERTMNEESSILYENIQDNVEFQRIQSLPAAKGASNWIIDNNHCVFLYTGLINAVKTDKINLNIFDCDPKTFICRVTVDKGKKGLIRIYLYCARL